MLFTCREGVGGLSRQQSSFSPDRGHFITLITLRSFVSEVVDYFTLGEVAQSDTTCVDTHFQSVVLEASMILAVFISAFI